MAIDCSVCIPKNETINCNINDIIVLCNIIDEFEDFIVNLGEFSKGSFGYSKLQSLYKYVKDNAFTSKKVKQFYLQNSKVLNTIRKYSYISNFLLVYFNYRNGKYCTEIMQMFNYLKKHKEDKEKILSVLNKLKEIGFDRIKFNEFLSFDDDYVYKKFDSHFCYLDGYLEVIPSLDGIKYKSTNANYEIKISTIPLHSAVITLNNLLFDVNNLPRAVSYDETIGKILYKKDKKQENDSVLRNAVEFDYYLRKINLFVDKLDQVLGNIKESEEKENIKIVLSHTRDNVDGFKKFIKSYEQSAIDEKLFTEKALEEERSLYKRRKDSYYSY